MNQKLLNIVNDIVSLASIGLSLALIKDLVSVFIPIATFAVLLIINHRKIAEGLKTFVDDYIIRKK